MSKLKVGHKAQHTHCYQEIVSAFFCVTPWGQHATHLTHWFQLLPLEMLYSPPLLLKAAQQDPKSELTAWRHNLSPHGAKDSRITIELERCCTAGSWSDGWCILHANSGHACTCSCCLLPAGSVMSHHTCVWCHTITGAITRPHTDHARLFI